MQENKRNKKKERERERDKKKDFFFQFKYLLACNWLIMHDSFSTKGYFLIILLLLIFLLKNLKHVYTHTHTQ